jgi:hypothetical protein
MDQSSPCLEAPAASCALTQPFLRALKTEPTLLGHAGGHVTLANEEAVVFAGEIELDEASNIISWTLVSGTYQFPLHVAAQSTLPMSKLW